MHGHNWKVEVEVSGNVLDNVGMVLDFKDIRNSTNDIVDNFNVAPDCVYTIKELAEIGVKACGKEHLEIIYDIAYQR